jgi:hypothetical protein
LKPRRGGLETYPGHQCLPFVGSDPFSPRLRAPTGAEGSGPLGNPIGARAGSAYLPCKEIELGSSPRCSTKSFPDHPMVGAPVVTREIQVRVLVGEPIRRDRLIGQDTRFSTEQPEFKSPSRRQQAHVAQLDKAPDYESGRCRFESCRVLQSSACRGAWSSLPALEAGDRWFKSIHADHYTRRRNRSAR